LQPRVLLPFQSSIFANRYLQQEIGRAGLHNFGLQRHNDLAAYGRIDSIEDETDRTRESMGQHNGVIYRITVKDC
jgi:hypothetical protein